MHMIKGMVGIVIVTFNRLSLLKEAVEAIRSQTYKNYELIVVDNGSTDNTSDWLKQQNDIYTISQDNCGGAGGFFTGMKYVSEHRKYDYCWIMDDDTICNKFALEYLVSSFKKINNIGFVCSIVSGTMGEQMNVPGIDSSVSKNGYPCTFEQLYENNMIRVKYATFVSVLTSCENIREFGLPIRQFFIWGDDIEYTLRLSSIKKCYLVGTSHVIHKRIITGNLNIVHETNPNRINNFFYSYRNSIYIARKYYSKFESLKLAYKFFKELMAVMRKGKLRHCNIIIKGIYAGIRFNPNIVHPKTIEYNA